MNELTDKDGWMEGWPDEEMNEQVELDGKVNKERKRKAMR